jgi:hypothetical protein
VAGDRNTSPRIDHGICDWYEDEIHIFHNIERPTKVFSYETQVEKVRIIVTQTLLSVEEVTTY